MQKCISVCMNLFMILPTILSAMILLDLFMIFSNSIAYPLIFVAIIFQFGWNINKSYEQLQDRLFKNLFGMSVMDAQGFKWDL